MKPFHETADVTLYCGDCREIMAALPEGSAQTCVTSPPYWGLRDYGVEGQLGLEATPEEYVAAIVAVFREVRRVLRDDGTAWLNLGDSYAGSNAMQGGDGSSSRLGPKATDSEWTRSQQAMRTGAKGQIKRAAGLKPKDLAGIPWRVAFALQADGWYLRSDIIWHKPNPMPESVTDRPTKAHEYLFLLAKSDRYFYDADAIKEPSKRAGEFCITHPDSESGIDDGYDGHRTRRGLRRGVTVADNRNRRSVWTVASKPFKGAHFATFPPKLIEPCVLAGCQEGGVVLDPFAGAGTTGLVSLQNGRRFVGCELNRDYCKIIVKRLKEQAGKQPLLEGVGR